MAKTRALATFFLTALICNAFILQIFSTVLSSNNSDAALGGIRPDDSPEKVEENVEEEGMVDLGNQDMLHWAIKHADPDKLQELAAKARHMTPKELAAKQQEIKEVLGRMPTDAELMKRAIADLTISSLSVEEHLNALRELQVLAEPLDNANDLHKLGGLLPVLEALGRPEVEIRTLAAWVLGIAAQNNELVQNQILELGGLPRLMGMLDSASAEEIVKALFATSAIIRNNAAGRATFFSRGGVAAVCKVLERQSAHPQAQKKAVVLVADLALASGDSRGGLNDGKMLGALVGVLEAGDVDTVEKVLMAMEALAVDEGARRGLKGVDRIGAVLQKVQGTLSDALKQSGREDTGGEWSDYVEEVESLRRRVEDRILD